MEKKHQKYPPPIRIRLGELADSANERVKEEGTDISKLIRRALSHYLSSAPDISKVDSLISELVAFRRDFARTGSNLNQLALAFNIEDKIDSDQLAATHADLRQEFKQLMSILRGIENQLKGRP